jgi:hypothetical protein
VAGRARDLRWEPDAVVAAALDLAVAAELARDL